MPRSMVCCEHPLLTALRAAVLWSCPMSQNTEFSVQLAHHYDQRSPLRWLVSHVWRYKLFAILTMSCYIAAWQVFPGAPLMVGRARQEIIPPASENGLLWIALTILGFLMADGLFMLIGSLS